MKQMTKTYAPAKCAWCDGTGRWNVAPGVPASCIVCGGKGHVSAIQPAAHCQQCEGSGRRSVSNPCLTCAGTGWEHISSGITI
jgi:DnaJ-class molecular chaperone